MKTTYRYDSICPAYDVEGKLVIGSATIVMKPSGLHSVTGDERPAAVTITKEMGRTETAFHDSIRRFNRDHTGDVEFEPMLNIDQLYRYYVKCVSIEVDMKFAGFSVIYDRALELAEIRIAMRAEVRQGNSWNLIMNFYKEDIPRDHAEFQCKLRERFFDVTDIPPGWVDFPHLQDRVASVCERINGETRNAELMPRV